MGFIHHNISEKLIKNNIKPSYQRIKILGYLSSSMDHPTAEQIYNDLLPEMPTLSKTTVYNSINLFIEAGIIQAVELGDHETRYDYIVNDHGHFKCIQCGGIFDFPLENDAFASKFLNGFWVKDKNVYCKGICGKCLANKNQ